MRGVLLLTLAAAVCVTAAWWIAALPGSITMTIAGTTLEASTPVALTLVALLFVVLYLIIRLFAWVVRLPRLLRRSRQERNRVRGDAAISRALVALAANDAGGARREAERSRRLLGDTPLTLLLAANAGQQAGRDGEAQQIFQLLAERKDGKLLGLRGLLRQAIDTQDWDTASALARQAETAHPGAKWLIEERQRMAVQTGQWQEALRLSAPARSRESDAGTRAAFAIAAADAEPDAAASLRLAKQAWDTDPALAPAALAYAGRLRHMGRERAALDVLRRSWALAPHPDLAGAYLYNSHDPMARIRAAQELAGANPQHPDTALMQARTALEAGLTAEARRHAEMAQAGGLDDRRFWVLMADLAEADGHPEAAQEALRHLATAQAEPSWRCAACGTPHTVWHPVCDACATPGRIHWSAVDTGVVAARAVSPAAIEGFS
jgi:HemY protein